MPGTVQDALNAVTPARLVALLADLVAVPSVTGSAAESEAQHHLDRVLRSAGCETDLWQIDLAETLAAPGFPGLEADRTEAWGLVGTVGGGDGPTLILNGHIDVVPIGDRAAWSVGPWSGVVRDGHVVGRGSCDMKAGLAAQVMAATVLREARVPLRGRVQLQSVVGEEDGGLGTFATLRRGYTGDAAVVGEPTRLGVVTASAGALTFRLTVPGRAAHGSMRLAGVDALDGFWTVREALRAFEAERNADAHPLMAGAALPYPLSIGIVRAGDWASTVPDLLVAEGRLGVALEETAAEARRAFEECVAGACAADAWLRDHPATVEWHGGQFEPGALPAGNDLADRVGSAHASLHGGRPEVLGVPYGSDLRLLTAAGVPTVLYGPGDVRDAHAPDESVSIAELVACTQTLVRLAATFLDGLHA